MEELAKHPYRAASYSTRSPTIRAFILIDLAYTGLLEKEFAVGRRQLALPQLGQPVEKLRKD